MHGGVSELTGITAPSTVPDLKGIGIFICHVCGQ